MNNGNYTLVFGGSKGIGLGLIQHFNSKNINTISISRSDSEWISKYNKHISFDLIEFENYKFLLNELKKYNIENVIFNLGDGSIFSEDKNKQYNYSLKINYLYAEKFIELIKNNDFKNLKNLVFINSICRFENVNCREDYRSSKSKLFELFKNNVVSFAEKNIKLNSITLGDVYHSNSVWKEKFSNKSEKIKYLKKTKLNQDFVNLSDVISTVDFIINNSSLYGEDVVLDCGHLYLLDN